MGVGQNLLVLKPHFSNEVSSGILMGNIVIIIIPQCGQTLCLINESMKLCNGLLLKDKTRESFWMIPKLSKVILQVQPQTK